MRESLEADRLPDQMRRIIGESVEEIENRTGIPAKTLSNYRTGRSKPPLPKFLEILKVKGLRLVVEPIEAESDLDLAPNGLGVAAALVDQRLHALECRLDQWLPDIDLTAGEEMSPAEQMAQGGDALIAGAYRQVTPSALVDRLSRIESGLELRRLETDDVKKEAERAAEARLAKLQAEMELLALDVQQLKASNEDG